MLTIEPIPLLTDNYAYLLVDEATGITGVLDPSEAAPVIAVLKQRKLKLDFVLNTHHHGDHCGGNLVLKAKTGCKIVGPGHDRDRIPGIDIAVFDGETFSLGQSAATAIHTPGHTRGQINYWFQLDGALFTGDTLFSLGCGRMFEGSAEQMWSSLAKLLALPQETLIYCGHEYTLNNAKFALSVEPGNLALQKRIKIIEDKLKKGEPTIPVMLADEINENPFLRPDSIGIRSKLGMIDAQDAAVFGELRKRKDRF